MKTFVRKYDEDDTLQDEHQQQRNPLKSRDVNWLDFASQV